MRRSATAAGEMFTVRAPLALIVAGCLLAYRSPAHRRHA